MAVDGDDVGYSLLASKAGLVAYANSAISMMLWRHPLYNLASCSLHRDEEKNLSH